MSDAIAIFAGLLIGAAFVAAAFYVPYLFSTRNYLNPPVPDRIRTANLERDRLANLLSHYDRCKCGKQRWQHSAQWPACRGFVLDQPADYIETILEAKAQTYGGSPVSVTLGTLSEVAGRERLRKAVKERRKRLMRAA